MGLIISKILISIFIVISLAEISKRVDPELGGLLSGLPLGSGLSVYFISLEKGVDYLVTGLPWGIAGLVSTILFCLAYLWGGKTFATGKLVLNIFSASVMGIMAFLISGFFLSQINFNMITALVIFLLFFILNLKIMNKSYLRNKREPKNKDLNSLGLILLRGLIVGLIIIVITGLGSVMGSKWAGILSSFPSMLYALIIILHYEEQDTLYPAVIYGFSYGISTLVVFYITCWYILPSHGLNIGYLLIYTISFVYLFLINKSKLLFKSKILHFGKIY